METPICGCWFQHVSRFNKPAGTPPKIRTVGAFCDGQGGARGGGVSGMVHHKVVPQFGIAKLVNITPITMVYGRYNYS